MAPYNVSNPTPNLLGFYPSTQYFASFTGIVGTTYYWTVVAENGTKKGIAYPYSFTITSNTIQGRVYYDASNTCSSAVGWNQGAGLTAQLTNPGTRTASVPSGAASAGEFNTTAPNGLYGTLRLLNLPSTFKCSTACSQQCPSKTGLISPSTGHNFFITDQILSTEGWWQAVGGPVYAGALGSGTTIRSELPLTTSKLILPGASGGTDGALIRASGNVDLGDGTVSASGWSAKSTYQGKKTDYAYFAAGLGVVQGQASDWASNVIYLANYPTTKDFGYMKPVGGAASLATPWNIGSAQKFIIFVDGDLVINQNIQVAPGGFLAIIARGDISIATNVTSVEGLLVASGDFITITKYNGTILDSPLNIEGSVVAWGTIDLQRNLGGIANTNGPAEKFTHRPDLLTNMPAAMKTFAMEWQEVPAGSF